ncbi:MAG: carbon-nitrogen hydrolase family protein [Cyanobacteria bacterium J06638_20]
MAFKGIAQCILKGETQNMKIGLAQVESHTGDIDGNIRHHLDVLSHLGASDVDLVMFPELSLSNYEPEIAESAGIDPKDKRLAAFQEFADKNGIAIGVGASVCTAEKPLISALVFVPHRTCIVVDKVYLHEDELPYFSAKSKPATVLELAQNIGIAICYEISVDAHIKSASTQNMDIYLASVAKTVAGITSAKERLSVKAKEFNVPILIVNSIGTCEGKEAGGGSAIIESDGTVVASLNDKEEAILIYDLQNRHARKFPINAE